MRFELYGRNAATRRRFPLGIEARRIPDRAFTSSSHWDTNHRASNARLNAVRRGRRTGAWSSRHNKRGQWIQVDIGTLARITAIATQGRQDANQWVTRYFVSYSKDGRRFWHYGHGRRILYFRGNKDRNTVVYNKFLRPFKARYVRIYPQSWKGHISMRFELYGHRLARPGPRPKPSGISNGRLPNKYITASSVWNKYHAAWLARLHRKKRGRYIGSWSARANNRRQWIQFNLRKPKTIYKVVTQGRSDANQWVTKYIIKYSQNGRHWVSYKKNSVTKVLVGNRDRNSLKENIFRPRIIATYVRIYPVSWYRHISLRAEFYITKASRYTIPLGIEDKKIPYSALRASSSWNRNHGPSRGRLNTVRRGHKVGAWCARKNNRKQWIQVDLGKRTTVTQILTQGRQDANQWVKTYTVSYSNNGRNFRAYRAKGRVKIFRGNFDRNTIVIRTFRPSIRARFVRVHPRTWYRHISIRFALRGRRIVKRTPPRRVRALGMQSGRIGNKQITASSNWDGNHISWLARLHRKARGRQQGGWSARHNNRKQYIQVRFRRPKVVNAVATQGRQNANQWVTRYYISYSLNAIHYVPYKIRGRTKVFVANRNRNSVVLHRLRPAFRALSIRIHPISWRGHISMRFELYGRNAVSRRRFPLGIEARRIPDRAFTSSSHWDINHRASNARLNAVRRGRRTGAWSSRYNRKGQWIQVDIGGLARVNGIATQGRQDANQWVTQYFVKYSTDGRRFYPFRVGRRLVIFRGNKDRNTIVYNKFYRPLKARFVRLFPLRWSGHISLRLELYGRRLTRPVRPKPSGISNGRLPNKYITASSVWNKYHAAWLARLHRKKRGRYIGSWSARANNRRQWIQFNLRAPKRIYKVVTQGRSDANQWVTRYIIKYSQNGRHWVSYKQNSVTKVLVGNRDRNSLKENIFRPPIIATYVRIYPVSWYRHISLRAEFYITKASRYTIPLGIEDKKIPYSALRASTKWDKNHGPSNARLNTVRRGRKTGAWSAKRNDRRQWIQVDLGKRTTVTQILTQGRQDANQWVKTYTVSYSNNGRNFRAYRAKGRVRVFAANGNRNTIVVRLLRPAITARFVRLHPRTWYGHISLRFGLRGRRIAKTKPVPRVVALGMKSGRIRNNQIKASSNWDKYHISWLARLYRKAAGRYQGGWSARHNNRKQYLQVRFRRPKVITAIATQGRQNADQWVTRYYVTYSFDGFRFVPLRVRRNTKIFTANRNRNSVQLNRLPRPIVARAIRIHPIRWRGHISMRLELYGRNAVTTRRFPLGIEARRIPDRAFTSSSHWDINHRASNARLNFVRRGSRTGAWSSRHNKRGQWIQVDIGTLARITGIATQGRQDANQWVTRYFVSYSRDGKRFWHYGHGRRIVYFRGNKNRNSVVYNRFYRPFKARFVRIYPQNWHGHISLRFELFGRRLVIRPRPKPCGISNGRLPNKYIKASSVWNKYHAAWLARLHRRRRGRYIGSWSARANNRRQWIQFDLRAPKRIYKVVTQGRSDANQWVTSYYITYSQDGRRWVSYKKNSATKVLRANRDRNTLKSNYFRPTIVARFIRINPVSWYKHISLRAEFYVTRASTNSVPIGIEDKKIPKRAFKASSSWNRNHGPSNARLNTVRRGRTTGAWSARKNNRRQWLQVDLGKRTLVTKILTQGRQDANQWVKTYTVSYSNNGRNFRAYRARGRVRIFSGNSDRNTIVIRKFKPAIRARFIRVHPRTWYGHISMRFGLRGKRGVRPVPPKPGPGPGPKPGARALGMQSGYIRNNQITASSNWDGNHISWLARLNNKRRGRRQSGWSARHNNRNQFIQIRFRSPKKVVAIATQGRQGANQWVTRYTVTYSLDGVHFTRYIRRGRTVTFAANRNRNTIRRNNLRPAIKATYIRIHPVSWYGHISMRLELYGRPAKARYLPLGVVDRRIPDRAMTSSSHWDNNHRAANARLNFVRRGRRTGAWSSRHNRRGQWLQIDIGSLARVTGIATQGRQDANQWVTSYFLSYSRDGRRFRTYRYGRRTAVFKANRNRNSIVFKKLPRSINTRYIRVYPRTWYGHISMRLELYGQRYTRRPRPRPCGISNGRLPNKYITASSVWNRYHAAWLARLHRKKRGRYIGSWSARRNNKRQWIQFNFRTPKRIYKVVTQGRSDASQWVRSFVLTYSQNGRNWVAYMAGGRPKVFPGNRDRNSLMENVFDPPFTATYVRINPKSWHRHISLRAEFYVVRASSTKVPIGIEDRTIRNSAFKASTQWDRNHGPHLARLYNRRRGRQVGGWSARRNDKRQWIQVDVGARTVITKILTQGRQDANQWVKTYTVAYSNDGRRFKNYRVKRRIRVFLGNTDRNTVMIRVLRPVIRARFVRILPRTWYGHISLRFGLRGQRTRPVKPTRRPQPPTRRPVPFPLAHCPVTLDLAFLIDGSSAIGRRNFHLEKLFIKRVASTFTITRHQTHIGLATYSNSANVIMRFRQYNSLGEVARAITTAPYPNRRGERLDLGLSAAYESFFRREPEYIQRTLLVVSHGKPNSYTFNRIRHITSTMERKGVKVFIVRLGSVRRGSLTRMTYKDKHVYYMRSFNDLLSNAGAIARAVCAQQAKETDIYKFKRMHLARPPAVPVKSANNGTVTQ